MNLAMLAGTQLAGYGIEASSEHLAFSIPHNIVEARPLGAGGSVQVTRLPFDLIFNVSGNRIIPQISVVVGNITFAASVPIPHELVVSGARIGDLTNCDLAVKMEESLAIIVGFYPSNDQPVSSH